MQFAFSYMYYMMQAPEVYDPDEIFVQLDGDGDDYLDKQELDYMALVLSTGKEKHKADDLYTLFCQAYVCRDMPNCTTLVDKEMEKMIEQFYVDDSGLEENPDGGTHDKKHLSEDGNITTNAADVNTTESNDTSVKGDLRCPLVDKDLFLSLVDIQDELKTIVEKKKRFKHEIMTEDEVEFYMVGNDYTKVKARLDELRQKGPKFICLNDDMGDDPSPQLSNALQNFYTGFFPKPCPFELPEGEINEFAYVDDWRAAVVQASVHRRNMLLGLLLCGVLLLLLPATLRLRMCMALRGRCRRDTRIDRRIAV
jgi:hypothetical protein